MAAATVTSLRIQPGAAVAATGVLLITAACAGGRLPGPVPPAAARAWPAAGSAAGPAPMALAAGYLAIAVAGNRRLEIDFGRLAGRDRSDLAAAQADLRDAAATERLFDRRLAGIAFPAETEKAARLLIVRNQARSALTMAAANSVTLAQLRGYQRRLAAANRPVEEAVRAIRSQLGLPPPDTS